MPSRWVIRLAGRCGPIPLTAPMAVVAGWLDDPRRDREPLPPEGTVPLSAPHGSSRRPWAISPPQLTGDTDRASGCLLEVRLLDDQLDERLLAACTPRAPVRLGRYHLHVAASPQRLEHRSWQALRTRTDARAWQVRMTSPATFRSRQRSSPWPAPESIARGLGARWQLLDPATTPDDADAAAREVWVSDLDGHNELIALNETVVNGFVGRIRYVCDGTSSQAETFDALMAFAAFAGIGSHTTFGFGSIALEDTWQPVSGLPAGTSTIDLTDEAADVAR